MIHPIDNEIFDIAWIREHGIKLYLSVPAKKPGGYYVRVAVKDRVSGNVGSAYEYVEIPDLKKNRLSLSDIFLIDRDEYPPQIHSATTAESLIQPGKSELAAELPVAVRPMPQEVPIQDTAALAEQINSQLDAVLAQVALLESRQGGVSEAEIDSLLRQAQQEISGHAYHPPRDSVDAMALLMETEEELDRSFREQLFDRLKTGFARVRTAVATRND